MQKPSSCIFSLGGGIELEFGACLLPYLDIKNELDLSIERPVIKTITGGDDPIHAYKYNYVLHAWANNWALAGWNPCAYNLRDVQHHPDYRELLRKLKAADIPPRNWHQYVRFLAMSLTGGGWYAYQAVIPFRSKYSYLIGLDTSLPNNGKLTVHHSMHLDILSGSQSEWERMTQRVMHDLRNAHSDHGRKYLFYEDPDMDAIEKTWEIIKIHSHDEFCQATKNKIAVNLLRIAKAESKESYEFKHFLLHTSKKMMRNCMRPTMYTFFTPAVKHKPEEALELLEQWKIVWSEAGWKTVVLTIEDAKPHPLYEPFKKALDGAERHMSDYDRMCFFRWLAMAESTKDKEVNGGYMSDIDTFPLHSNPIASLKLPNEGNFTSMQGGVPSLIVGSNSEWNRLSNLLYNSYIHHTHEFWSDMLALQDLYHQSAASNIIFNHEVIGIDDIFKRMMEDVRNIDPNKYYNYCPATTGLRAVHFSHFSCGVVRFCLEKRHFVAIDWTNKWKEQCMKTS